MKLLAAAALLVAIPVATAAQQDQPAFPTWLAGSWSLSQGDRWTEEFWTQPRGGVMLGASREGQGEALRTWESIRIVRKADGSLAYVPMPNGGEPVEFALVEQDAQSVVFANATHDFPQRIRYWREGDKLNAEIAMIDGSRAISWTYAPMPD